MRFPDFYAAKREEVPDYISAAYLQARADNEAAAEERLRKQDRANNIQAVGGGLMNAAQMDLGDGKTPISMALRYAKDKMGGGPSPSSTLGPVQSSATLQSPSYMASPQGQGIDVAAAMRNPAGDNWQMPGTRPPAPQAAPQAAPQVPPARAADPGMWKPPAGGSPAPGVKTLGVPKAAPSVPVKPPATLPSGMEIPTGPASYPGSDALGMVSEQLKNTSITPNMTASVGNAGARPTNAALTSMLRSSGGKGVESAVSTPVAANIASKGATEAVGKGLGGAFAQAGGAAVPGVGAAMGAIPAALRGDTWGAVKGGVGGAASSTLMAAGPAMAAAGPAGWAGMAGLAALSLYGMLG